MMAYDTEESDGFYLDEKVAFVSHQILSPLGNRFEARDDIAVESQYL